MSVQSILCAIKYKLGSDIKKMSANPKFYANNTNELFLSATSCRWPVSHCFLKSGLKGFVDQRRWTPLSMNELHINHVLNNSRIYLKISYLFIPNTDMENMLIIILLIDSTLFSVFFLSHFITFSILND